METAHECIEKAPPQAELAIKSLEEEISNSLRGDRRTNGSRSSRRAAKRRRTRASHLANSCKKLVATSIAEIEKLISDLQVARNHLKAEADRIEQDITRYAHLSETASASVKIITESLGHWRNGNEAMRNAVSGEGRSDAA